MIERVRLRSEPLSSQIVQGFWRIAGLWDVLTIQNTPDQLVLNKGIRRVSNIGDRRANVLGQTARSSCGHRSNLG
jgi:hypothetical protein